MSSAPTHTSYQHMHSDSFLPLVQTRSFDEFVEMLCSFVQDSSIAAKMRGNKSLLRPFFDELAFSKPRGQVSCVTPLG